MLYTVMKRRLITGLLAGITLLGAAVTSAHSIVYAGVAGQLPIAVSFTATASPTQPASTQNAAAQAGIAAQFSYSGSLIGVPANADFRVFSPNDAQNAFQTGRADRQGRVVFVPDQPGLWRVELRSPEGHEATAELDIGEDLAVPQPTPWLSWVLLLSLTVNLALFVFLWQRLKNAAST